MAISRAIEFMSCIVLIVVIVMIRVVVAAVGNAVTLNCSQKCVVRYLERPTIENSLNKPVPHVCAHATLHGQCYTGLINATESHILHQHYTSRRCGGSQGTPSKRRTSSSVRGTGVPGCVS